MKAVSVPSRERAPARLAPTHTLASLAAASEGNAGEGGDGGGERADVAMHSLADAGGGGVRFSDALGAGDAGDNLGALHDWLGHSLLLYYSRA